MSRNDVTNCMLCAWSMSCVMAIAGCGNVLHLDDYAVDAMVPPAAPVSLDASASTIMPAAAMHECTTNRECTQRASQFDADTGSTRQVPSVCTKPAQKCVPLLSADCDVVTGDYSNDDAIIIGSMFSTSGAQESINRERERSAILAVEEINMAGGIPSGTTSAGGRPLVMVSCDEAHLLLAGGHLVNELHVPAIIGPNTSQDTLDLSNKLTIAAGALLMSPTAVASSISDLLDDNLTWQVVPTDVQRAPLMIQEIGVLEAQLKAARQQSELKLAIIYRDDALGQGTRLALNSLVFNGKNLSDPDNLGGHVHVSPYQANAVDQSALVDATLKFAPDIIVLAGTAEAITQVMVPLEQAWPVPASRPEYVLIDSSKTNELITAVTGNSDLRHRIRGTGTTPDPRSVSVNEAFMVSYATRHPDEPPNLFGMGAAYDATYAVAYAITALRGKPITGRAIAQALPMLASGGPEVELQSSKVLLAFRKLTEGTPLTVIGTNAPLHWDDHGAIAGGTIELWCISEVSGKPGFDSSGVMLDLSSGQLQGQYVQCAP
jgi:ABC-type branched-subunit amino acid transport system substrate-binding protein